MKFRSKQQSQSNTQSLSSNATTQLPVLMSELYFPDGLDIYDVALATCITHSRVVTAHSPCQKNFEQRDMILYLFMLCELICLDAHHSRPEDRPRLSLFFSHCTAFAHDLSSPEVDNEVALSYCCEQLPALVMLSCSPFYRTRQLMCYMNKWQKPLERGANYHAIFTERCEQLKLWLPKPVDELDQPASNTDPTLGWSCVAALLENMHSFLEYVSQCDTNQAQPMMEWAHTIIPNLQLFMQQAIDCPSTTPEIQAAKDDLLQVWKSFTQFLTPSSQSIVKEPIDQSVAHTNRNDQSDDHAINPSLTQSITESNQSSENTEKPVLEQSTRPIESITNSSSDSSSAEPHVQMEQ